MQDILGLDVTSYATAIGHAAALRLAQVLGPEFDPNYWFCDGGFAHEVDGEAMVNALGAYVVERTAKGAVVGAEQLFIKAGELGAHRFPANRFDDLDLWARVAYGAFASVVGLCARELGKAQEEARALEARLRVANEDFYVIPPLEIDETQLPATGDAVVGDAAPAPVPPDGGANSNVAEGVRPPSATPELAGDAEIAAPLPKPKKR
jgi:hypothetical protein